MNDTTPLHPSPATPLPAPLPAGVTDIRRLVPAQRTPASRSDRRALEVQGALALDLWRAGSDDTSAPIVPDVEAWARRFSQAVVEAIGGVRPVSQLVRWTSRRVYADLERRVRLVAEARGAGRAPTLVRPQVRSVHVSYPVAGVAEIAVHVAHGHRSRAMAARLEFQRGLWCCTALEVG